MQYPVGIPPFLRTNIDYVFILRENVISNRKRIYEHYAGMIPSFDAFCQIMDNCAEDYECLVIDNTTSSATLKDRVFWYKAESHADFRMFPGFWDLEPFDRNDHDDDDDETYRELEIGESTLCPIVNELEELV